jgi:hypothetical protein
VTLKEGDKKWLREEIERQVRKSAGEAVEASQSQGWKRGIRWLRDWGVLAVLITIPVTELAIIVAISIFAFNGIKEQTEFRTKTGLRLDRIEAVLRTQNAAQAPAKILNELSSLDAKTLAVNLPALRTISEQPVSKVSPAPSELRGLASTLSRVNETTEDYWPTALRFIQFASARFATNAPPPGSPISITLKDTRVNNAIHISPRSVIAIDGAVIEDETFTDSRIIFSDNPSILRNVKFINCAFEFPTLDKPTPYLEATGRELLRTGIQSASIAGL